LSLGKQILASTSSQIIWRISCYGRVQRANFVRENNVVCLKNHNGVIVAKRVVEAQIQVGHDVARLILFPIQTVVRTLEVHPCRIDNWGLHRTNYALIKEFNICD
jgi:hypothetical protein